jgi:hypothetical protein
MDDMKTCKRLIGELLTSNARKSEARDLGRRCGELLSQSDLQSLLSELREKHGAMTPASGKQPHLEAHNDGVNVREQALLKELIREMSAHVTREKFRR